MLKLIKNTFIRITLLIILIVVCILSFAFKDELTIQFNHVEAYYNVYLGDKKYKQGKFQEAIDFYKKGLELYPEHIKARYNLGNIYVVYEDYESALLCYEKTLKYAPNFISARINLALILSEKFFDFDKAIEEYQTAINSKPLIIKIPYIYNNLEYIKSGKAVAYYNLGLAYKSKSLTYGDGHNFSRVYLKKAIKSYKNSLEIEPESYDARYNLATSFHLLKNYTEAKEEYCKAINIEPLNYEAHYNLAVLFRELKYYIDSIAEFEKAGLILNSRGDSYISHYIYDILNEVYQKASVQQDYLRLIEKLDDEPINSTNITYVNGKVVITEQLDKAIIENMKTCGSIKSKEEEEMEEQ